VTFCFDLGYSLAGISSPLFFRRREKWCNAAEKGTLGVCMFLWVIFACGQVASYTISPAAPGNASIEFGPDVNHLDVICPERCWAGEPVRGRYERKLYQIRSRAVCRRVGIGLAHGYNLPPITV
jgi:hypothetical protein